MASIKALCRGAYDNSLEEQLEQEAQRMVRAQATEESREGIGAFLEKRTPDFTQLRQPRA
ncbi:enoyl-CoA hydratase [compost metagenome]